MVTYRGSEFEDLDVSAVIERRPDVVLVDELAHTSPDGRKRYEDVEDILDAGIDVLTTVNVANLLSVRDVAARITGAGALEGVPDDVVRAGDVVLVDLPPEALRRRIASGQVYSADRVGGALANYFRPSNLALLSQLARSWLDGTVDETFAFLDREAAGRPKVIAGVSSSTRGRAVIEHAAVLAGEDDAELDVVHVDLQDGLGHSQERLDQYREMAENVGARFREVLGVMPPTRLGDWRAVSARVGWWWGHAGRGSATSYGARSRLGFDGARRASRSTKSPRDDRPDTMRAGEPGSLVGTRCRPSRGSSWRRTLRFRPPATGAVSRSARRCGSCPRSRSALAVGLFVVTYAFDRAAYRGDIDASRRG